MLPKVLSAITLKGVGRSCRWNEQRQPLETHPPLASEEPGPFGASGPGFFGVDIALPDLHQRSGTPRGDPRGGDGGAGFNSEAGVALGLLWFAMQLAPRLAATASWFMNSSESGDELPASRTQPSL